MLSGRSPVIEGPTWEDRMHPAVPAVDSRITYDDLLLFPDLSGRPSRSRPRVPVAPGCRALVPRRGRARSAVRRWPPDRPHDRGEHPGCAGAGRRSDVEEHSQARCADQTPEVPSGAVSASTGWPILSRLSSLSRATYTCRPFHDQRGIRSPSGTSSGDRGYRAIVVVVAHAK